MLWPFITTGLVVVCCHPVMVLEGSSDPTGLFGLIGCSFGVVLLTLALLRARLGARLSDGAALVLCAVPLLVGLALGEVPVPLDLPGYDGLLEDAFLAHRFEAWTIVDLRSLGALGSLALLVAELVVWCRFGSGSSSRSSIGRGLLLAIPFQLGWLAQLHADYVEPLTLNFLVPALALVLIPLSLVRGGSRTARLLVGLSFATFLVSVLEGGRLMQLAFGPHGCGPATDLERLRFHQNEVFGFAFFESFSWAPGLATLLFVRKHKVLVPLVAVALFLGADALAVSRLSRLTDGLSDSRRGDEFIPRGRGVRTGALHLSEFVVLDGDGTVLLRNPLADEDSLGQVLAAHSVEEELRSCWHGPSYESKVRSLSLTLDARLSPAQELALARVARRHGMVAIHFIEGEDNSPPGSPFVLSTHLARLVATTNEGTFFLGRQSVPSDCEVEGSRPTADISGLRWTEEWVLDMPE